MRGILRMGRILWCHARISPAHAGNTSRPNAPCASAVDQPRTCGEYVVSTSTITRERGSAPHMRGILPRGTPSITPKEDQPRTCGEYVMSVAAARVAAGSAPHMRGIPARRLVRAVGLGISPAHAGNTRRGNGAESRHEDQPRTCGEYSRPTLCGPYTAGSAPHMRGIRDGT